MKHGQNVNKSKFKASGIVNLSIVVLMFERT